MNNASNMNNLSSKSSKSHPEQPTVVIVPGLRDHVPDHWQTHLAHELPRSRTVPPLERDRLDRAAQVAAPQRELMDTPNPVLLVAHSAGVLTTVHWARQHRARVVGALLAAPPDFDAELPDGYPSRKELREHGWSPVPRERLPFPSIVAASRNDPLASFDRASSLAAYWGSRLVDLGPVGHLNPASGYGRWPRAMDLLSELGAMQRAFT
ncbi:MULTISPECIES: alpha/beta hydrolase [unclassified Streptomyces]|uniref:RBBP9/YdeN family alpha/beta hydrolase n=1 Tax=unclassified Streptomyces TaxID=2593676 RepID=UPI002E181E70|nr:MULTISPECIES: alpha/beta hydrolase [unclassified Streptomyces]